MYTQCRLHYLEKIDKCHDLRIELQQIWNVKAVVTSVFIGALGTISQGMHQYIKQIDIPVAKSRIYT